MQITDRNSTKNLNLPYNRLGRYPDNPSVDSQKAYPGFMAPNRATRVWVATGVPVSVQYRFPTGILMGGFPPGPLT